MRKLTACTMLVTALAFTSAATLHVQRGEVTFAAKAEAATPVWKTILKVGIGAARALVGTGVIGDLIGKLSSLGVPQQIVDMLKAFSKDGLDAFLSGANKCVDPSDSIGKWASCLKQPALDALKKGGLAALREGINALLELAKKGADKLLGMLGDLINRFSSVIPGTGVKETLQALAGMLTNAAEEVIDSLIKAIKPC